MADYLYFAHDTETNLVKIGWTKDLLKRLGALPRSIDLLRTTCIRSTYPAREVEREVHEAGKGYRVTVGQGSGRTEWFHPEAARLLCSKIAFRQTLGETKAIFPFLERVAPDWESYLLGEQVSEIRELFSHHCCGRAAGGLYVLINNNPCRAFLTAFCLHEWTWRVGDAPNRRYTRATFRWTDLNENYLLARLKSSRRHDEEFIQRLGKRCTSFVPEYEQRLLNFYVGEKHAIERGVEKLNAAAIVGQIEYAALHHL